MREKLLTEHNNKILGFIENGVAIPQELLDYRNSLRNLTNTDFVKGFTFPQKPEGF